MKGLQFVGQLGSPKDTKDRGARFSVVTPEIENDQFGVLRDLSRGNVKVSLMPADETPEDVVKMSKELEVKTPSQRLRAVLYKLFKQQSIETDFEVYYRKWMEAVIEKLKGRLES